MVTTTARFTLYMATPMDPAVCKKRRGVTRASLTRLATRLRDLQGKTDQPDTLALAKRAKQKLIDLKTDFMTHHLALVDVITIEESLEAEQAILDSFDEEVATLEIRIQYLITACSSSNSSTCKVASKKLDRLSKGLSSIKDSPTSIRLEGP